MNRQARISVLAVGLALSVAAGTATASIWAEVGDAGDLPGTAQDTATAGAPPLTNITGALVSESFTDADMFRIYLDGSAFGATTIGQPGTLSDTQLYLFDASGNGVIGNDDTGASLRSSISLAAPTPGFYFLAISAFDFDPVGVGGEIFTDNLLGAQTPTGPGSPGPITGWDSLGFTGSYDILLQGVLPTQAVPEPSTLALLAGAMLFGGLGRRRQR